MKTLFNTPIIAIACLVVALVGGATNWVEASEVTLSPRSPAVQARLAEATAESEDWDEALRRWIMVIYYFGPSEEEARALYEIGAISLRLGRSDVAAQYWQETVLRHRESEWGARAREALAMLGEEPPEPPEEDLPPLVTEVTPDDERQMLIGEAEMATGLFEFAVRDYLKVPNLDAGSPWAAEARFRAGMSQVLLGRPELAISQWKRVVEDYPESPFAGAARGAVGAWEAILEMTDLTSTSRGIEERWRPFRRYETEVERGLSYAEDLYENELFDYALQEYAKVLYRIYEEGEAPMAYVRHRMGVCAYRLRKVDAAARQWRRVMEDYPESPWAAQSSRALAAVSRTDTLSSEAGRPAPGLPEELTTGLVKRRHLAGELVECGLPLVGMKEYLKVIHVLTAGRPNPWQAEAAYRVGECQHLHGRPELAAAAWRWTIEQFAETEWAANAQEALDGLKARGEVLGRGLAEGEGAGP